MWAGTGSKNCTDPEILHKNLVATTDDLVKYLELNVYSNAGSKDGLMIYPNNTEIWIPVDQKFYGRCFTFKPTKEMHDDGLYKLEFDFRAKVIMNLIMKNNGQPLIKA